MSDVETPDLAPDAEEQPSRFRIFGLPISVVVAGVLGVVMLLLIVLLATREPASDRQVDSPLLGRQAPRILGTTIQDREFDSSSYDGRWLVVNFFATWCVPCVQEHPELVAFEETQREAGQANVISVVFDDDRASVERFFARRGGEWPVVLAEPETISEWGVAGVPESFVVDPSGVVRYKLIGGVTAQGLSELVR
jgi:cytochrome c biogenesis protein CcmG/thiol:disulfide interchange protein DsbE